MKIAILGSAPSSLPQAPFGDLSWQIWACSPGVYPHATRVDEFFELHRWEPGEIGKPASQKPWFTPEYVAWLGKQKKVWMARPVPEIPNSEAYPLQEMVQKFGSYFFTSSISMMMAMAIDQIIAAREQGDQGDQGTHTIGLYGVDMAANEEYGYQRAGCQYFATMAHTLGIELVVPPESDVLRPMPIYGIDESSHWMIKFTERRRELTSRKQQYETQIEQMRLNLYATIGALDDLEYHMKTWGADRDGLGASPAVWAAAPAVRAVVKEHFLPPAPMPLAARPPVHKMAYQVMESLRAKEGPGDGVSTPGQTQIQEVLAEAERLFPVPAPTNGG